MKRLVAFVLVAVLALGLTSTALADGPLNRRWLTVTTTTTAITTTTTAFPPTFAPRPPLPRPQPQSPASSSQRQISVATQDIKDYARATLDLLDRELVGSGWYRLKNAKRVLTKTNRVIHGNMTFVNEATGERVVCYMVTRTAESMWNSDRNYSTMFVWNYNTGSRAAIYEDDWLITSYGQSADDACIELVTWLINGAVQ